MFMFGACTDEKPKSQDIKQKEKTVPPPLLSVEYIELTKEKVPVWKQFSGKTKASSEQIVQSRTEGRLKKVFFKDGQLVNKGDKLYEIEGTTLEAQLEGAKAKLQVDQAEIRLAKADVERYASLVKDDLVPRQKYEQVKAKYAALLARIKSDNALIKERETNLGHSIVTAPISGRVSRNLVDIGNLVGYSGPTKLTTIVQSNPMEAYFNPSEEEMQLIRKYRMKKEIEALIVVPTKNKKLLKERKVRGSVNFESSVVDRETSTITSRAVFPNPDQNILPGTFVYVNLLVTNQLELLVLPSEFILRDQVSAFVYTINKEGKIVRKNIEVSYETKDFKVIQSGIEVGTHVVVSSFMKIKPGVKVKPVDVTDSKGIMALLRKHNLLSTP